MKQLLWSLAFLSLTSLSFAQKKTDYATFPSLVNEAKQSGNVKLADSLAQDYINNYLFKLNEDELMTKDNLKFVSRFLKVNSKGFNLFSKQSEKVNAILGNYAAQYGMRVAIYEAFIPKGKIDRKNFDWKSLERVIAAKFGSIGREEVYCNAMISYLEANDWINYGKYYKLYLEVALKHSVYDINYLSWPLFESVNDPVVLKFACEVVMKYAVEKWYQNDPASWDTYANLLHKTGKTAEAIKWEEKAVQMKKGQPDEKLYTDALEKMKKGLPTWPTPANN